MYSPREWASFGAPASEVSHATSGKDFDLIRVQKAGISLCLHQHLGKEEKMFREVDNGGNRGFDSVQL